MKKQSDLSRLMGYAGNYRYFTYASWVLSAVSALVALVPFVYIWKILRDVLNAAPDYAQAVNIPHYGWMAVLFAVLAYIIYIAALMCSHLSAFRVATNLRLEVSEHLATLPLQPCAHQDVSLRERCDWQADGRGHIYDHPHRQLA